MQALHRGGPDRQRRSAPRLPLGLPGAGGEEHAGEAEAVAAAVFFPVAGENAGGNQGRQAVGRAELFQAFGEMRGVPALAQRRQGRRQSFEVLQRPPGLGFAEAAPEAGDRQGQRDLLVLGHLL